ncbi:BT_3928 family protein [Cesiribacter sp. SM1]|uniref:BT_3928 family protein n=1 Tax=Cesiribacter sp. SM1 TaxID=2861196 RepID=UPI001CD62C5E|nr:BT_3928 family protein [Cesiribacter sp. SM1]
MTLLRLIARWFVGVLFIISGLIKINDPVGTQIKLEEYFEVFASTFSPAFHALVPTALVLSVVLSVLEVVLGVALLLKFRPKITTAVLLVTIVFFTALTLFSAVTGKVTDCGCFGDALVLTPWQSFMKDLVLLVLILILFVAYRKDPQPHPSPGAGLWVLTSGLISIAIAFVAIEHLPFIDFRAYKEGVHIPTAMQPTEPYRYTYIMAKGGRDYELSEYPDASEGYEYKDIRLLNPEAAPKITDFSIWNNEGDLTEQVLQGKKLLIIVHKVEKADTDNLAAIRRLAQSLGGRADALVVTSSDEASYEAFRHEHQIAIPYAFADATLLKTIMRSNPGLVLLQDGTVVEKWHHNDTPEATEVLKLLNR